MARERVKKETRNVGEILNSEVSADRLEMEKETFDAYNKIVNDKDVKPKAIKNVLDILQNDSLLSKEKKDEYSGKIKELFNERFAMNQVPTNPEELREEAVYLSQIAKASFIYMAQRCKIIRDKGYYTKFGYKDFISWIQSEIEIGKTAVYNYIDLVEVFGVQALELQTSPSKLIPTLPLFKSGVLTDENDEIKEKVLIDSEKKSFRQMTEEAKDLKIKYGLLKEETPKVDMTERINHSINRDCKKVREIRESGGDCLVIEIFDSADKKWLQDMYYSHRNRKK